MNSYTCPQCSNHAHDVVATRQHCDKNPACSWLRCALCQGIIDSKGRYIDSRDTPTA